ncbi:glycosyltransferase family 4 protein, partial [Candidatus Falkowbacteria bacterium]|nr:glycosyltransferase family 4 protein [Candidatus Falkowbacteria bacterium]
GAGYSEYPLNLIKNIPIILIGVFGYAVIQKNIKLQVYISKEVGDMVKKITYGKTCLLPILSEDPKDKYIDSGSTLRNILVIPNDYTVFGRIGRDDNGIFDSIGIEAFKKLLLDFNDVAYLIMSPPPALRDMVAKENIKNVYFLESSSSEHDIWSFHNAIDVLAHFRKDGESQGLNIVESMLCAKPIITHKSRIWNAHLEYLDESFCRIANIDDVEAYYNFMKEMVLLKKDGKLEEMGLKARKKAESIFLIKNRLPEIINWFENI